MRLVKRRYWNVRCVTPCLLALFLVWLLLNGWTRPTAQNSDEIRLSNELVTGSKDRLSEAIPGEILVRFRSEQAAQALTRHTTKPKTAKSGIEMSVAPIDVQFLPGLRLVQVDPAQTTQAMEDLSAAADVIYAEPNYVRRALATPNDTYYSNLWGLHNTGAVLGNPGFPAGVDIAAESAWNVTTGNRNIVIGVVDGGIDVSHPDLATNIWQNSNEIPNNGLDDDGNGFIDDFNGFDFFHNRGPVFDSGDLNTENHATHVAGIIGAVGNNALGVVGVNWQANMMSLKVFGRANESPFPSSVSLLVRAWAYAKKMRDLWISSNGAKGANIRILNNSLGGYGHSQAEADGVSALNDSGVLFVAAAGNDTRNNDVFPFYPAGYEFPNIISVAASSPVDKISSFSNVGPRTVHLAAPGQSILSTTSNSNYLTFAGTSMAAPYVAGAAALVLAAQPNISIDRLKAALIYNGDFVPAQAYKTLTGRRLNAFKALNAAAENDFTPPAAIFDAHIGFQNGRSVSLGWTAPGDDGQNGTAVLYDVRYSDNDLSSPQQFATSIGISPLAIPIPSPAGTFESATVEVPFGHTHGFIGIRATDNLGNHSPIAVVPVSVDGSAAGLYDVVESPPQPLSTGGTPLQLFGGGFPDDGYSMDYVLPFSFPYFGVWVRNVTVSCNGAIYFSTPPKFLLPPMTGSGAPLDAFSSIRGLRTNMMIAGMWDDLVITGVYAVTTDPNRIIFRWEGTTFDTPFDDGTSRGQNPISFEMELRSNGTIQLRYGSGNQKLFPVVGISGGVADAFVVSSHTSENSFLNLNGADTVTFTPRFAPLPTSANLQVVVNDQTIVNSIPTGGNWYTPLPAAVAPGEVIRYRVTVTDLGPDAASNAVLTAELPPGTSFVECENVGLTCTPPPNGTDGGTVTFPVGTLGQIFNNRSREARVSVRVNAPAGTTLAAKFTLSSSTTDLFPANNIAIATTQVSPVTSFGDIVAVEGGLSATVALRQDGTVWLWGLPFGSTDSPDFSLTTPRRVTGLSNVVAIAAGGSHALALKADGTVWSWGTNSSGELGNQLQIFGPFQPTQIPGLNNIKSIAASSRTSFAVAADGSVWAWGDNSSGELGDGSTNSSAVPVHLNTISNVRSMRVNANSSFAIKTDGSLWGWGSNTSGALGIGSAAPSVLIPTQLFGLTNVSAINTEDFHAVALQTDGSVWTWGAGGAGQLGNGTTTDSNVPVRVTAATNVTGVAATSLTCLAVRSDGKVWSWGDNRLVPTQLAAPVGVRTVAGWWLISAFIMSDNTLQMFGINGYGRLGDGTLTNRTTPAPVVWFPVVPAPVFSLEPNFYAFSRSVRIDCEAFDAVIHYTTNGSEPTLSDPVIAPGDAVVVDHSLTLKAKAWKTGLTPSTVTTANYSIGSNSTSQPSIQLSGSNYVISESNNTVQVTVTRTDASGSATIDYRTSDTDTFTVNCASKNGAAFARCDFATVVGTLTFGPGESSKTFNIPIINDGYAEGPETFNIVLSNATGAGLGAPSTAAITINDDESSDVNNPILQINAAGIAFFVRQHYLDFLGREPEPGEPWSAILNGCADQFNTDPNSPSANCDRIFVSGSFFGSPEFKDKGFYIIGMYRVSFNRLPTYVEFSNDLASISGTTAAEVFAKRAAYASSFVLRSEFTGIYAAKNNTDYVNHLMTGGQGQNYNLTSITTKDPANPDTGTKVTLTTADLISRLNASTMTRAQVLRAIAQSDEIVLNKEAVNSFVASQYYGYLRRAPDTGGFNDWVAYLAANPNDFRTMVNGFVNSPEYRLRFGPLQ